MSLLFSRRSQPSPAQLFDRWPGVHGAAVLDSGSLSSAMRLIPVYAAVAMISELVAATPVHAYRAQAEGRQRVAGQPQLLTNPWPGFTRFAWVQQAMASLLLRGNAYGLVLGRDELGWPTLVRWLDPRGMHVDEGATPTYTFNGRALDSSDVVHIPGVVLPGSCVGLSPIGLFRVQIETGMRVDRFVGDWFDTGVAPAGHLKNTLAERLDPVVGEQAKQRFREAVRNHDFFVSGSEWDWKALTIPAQDAQFLDAIKASATQVATIYRLAPEDVGGERGTGLTYKTLEQDELRFNRRTLLPWTSRLEATFTQLVPRGQYVKFNLDGQVRADLKTRMESHEIGLRSGLETLPEARALEDRAPLTENELKAWQQYMQVVKGGGQPAPGTREGQA